MDDEVDVEVGLQLRAGDPVKSVDQIGKVAIEQIKRMWADVEAEYNQRREDKDNLIAAIEGATNEQAGRIGSFRERMKSVCTSMASLLVTVTQPINDPKAAEVAIPAFLKQPLPPPPPERAGIVEGLRNAISPPRRPPPDDEIDGHFPVEMPHPDVMPEK